MAQEEQREGDWTEFIEVCRRLGPKRVALEMRQGDQVVLELGKDAHQVKVAYTPASVEKRGEEEVAAYLHEQLNKV